MLLYSLFFLALILNGVLGTPIKENNDKVGCVDCHSVDPTKINVHLIPHSHDDVGWLKTVDQYYFGMNTSIQHAGVQYIITSVFEALLEDKNRRFMQVETDFFWKWWKQQNNETRAKYRNLVGNGQIEMVNGAWSMNDEACSNYQSIIDQFTWGLRTLKETVGECGIPRVGWQIDPFGHSREQASLLAQMGYDGVMFGRLDYNDKEQRQRNKTLDFAWQGSQNLDNSIIFGSIFATESYSPPSGFCWEYDCTDDTIDDDPESVDYNIPEKVKEFREIITNYSNYFQTKNVIIPMGGDFHYEAAEINYSNMDRLIKAFENDTKINVIYSTPSCYIKAVNDAKPNLTLKTDDFFPYSNNNHSFWTGYFSSRPNFKRFERIGHNILQATKQLYAQSSQRTGKNYDDKLKFLREMMGIMQHHDAITGTEKQHVANDYVRGLSRAIEVAEKDLGSIIDELLNSTLNLDLSTCLLSNISICSVSQSSDQFVVIVYNPLAWTVTHYLRLPVDSGTYKINGEDENYDLIPTVSNFSYVPSSQGKPSTVELVFAAKDVPPLGFKIYHVQKSSNIQKPINETKCISKAFDIDSETNLLKSVTLNGKTLNISQTFMYYYSETKKVASGAYLFRPKNAKAESLGKVEILNSFSGKFVDELHQKWSTDKAEILQIIRWYKEEEYLEFDWLIGNIDVDKDKNGKEFISRFTVTESFNNDNVFYTDSNGREMIKRVKNSRNDYSYNASVEPVAGNYYPVTSKIVIKDEDKDVQVAVLTDRSEGGSSLESNQLELMVHRRILADDLKGVGEALNETEFGRGVYVRGSHYLIIGKAKGINTNNKTTSATERILAQKKLVQPWVGLAKVNQSFEDLKKNSAIIYEGLSKPFPENVNILTLEPWTYGCFLLRLEHILEKNEDDNLSKEASVDIWDAFKFFSLDKLVITTLGANQQLETYQRRPKYTWNVENKNVTYTPNSLVNNPLVLLSPMEIRTFLVDFTNYTQSSTSSPTTNTTQSPGAASDIKPTLILMVVFCLVVRIY